MMKAKLKARLVFLSLLFSEFSKFGLDIAIGVNMDSKSVHHRDKNKGKRGNAMSPRIGTRKGAIYCPPRLQKMDKALIRNWIIVVTRVVYMLSIKKTGRKTEKNVSSMTIAATVKNEKVCKVKDE